MIPYANLFDAANTGTEIHISFGFNGGSDEHDLVQQIIIPFELAQKLIHALGELMPKPQAPEVVEQVAIVNGG